MLSDEPAQTHSLTRAFTSRNVQTPIVGILTDTQILTKKRGLRQPMFVCGLKYSFKKNKGGFVDITTLFSIF